MKLLLPLLLTIIPTFVQAQIGHDLTIFSEDGLKFTLLVNGERINAEPQKSVKLENTHNDYARIRIEFEDPAVPPMERKVLQIADPGTGPKVPVTVVYALKEKKREQVLRFVSRSDKNIQQAPVIIINN